MRTFVLLLSPIAPHISEELWQALGETESLAYAEWPQFDEIYTREDTIELPIQINGRLRSRLIASTSATREELKQAALADSKVQKFMEGKEVRKVIIVPNKLINIVAG
jgi:leucyl-tRNA synthetase